MRLRATILAAAAALALGACCMSAGAPPGLTRDTSRPAPREHRYRSNAPIARPIPMKGAPGGLVVVATTAGGAAVVEATPTP